MLEGVLPLSVEKKKVSFVVKHKKGARLSALNDRDSRRGKYSELLIGWIKTGWPSITP